MDRKKIVICASTSFESVILEWKDTLTAKGYDVIKYPLKINGDLKEGYRHEFSDHYRAISEADIVLALNPEKKGIPGYIGAGVFAEIAFSIGLNKIRTQQIEVCYANEIATESLPYADELNLWLDLGWLKGFAE